MVAPPTRHEPRTDRLQLVQEVAGLWVEMQARLQAHFDALAAEHSLTGLQAKVLMQLDARTPVSMRALAGRLQYDPSNLTSVVDRLEKRGALRRQPDPRDRRVKGLLLTEEGAQVRQAFWERLINDAGPMGRLGPRELATLRDVLHTALRR